MISNKMSTFKEVIEKLNDLLPEHKSNYRLEVSKSYNIDIEYQNIKKSFKYVLSEDDLLSFKDDKYNKYVITFECLSVFVLVTNKKTGFISKKLIAEISKGAHSNEIYFMFEGNDTFKFIRTFIRTHLKHKDDIERCYLDFFSLRDFIEKNNIDISDFKLDNNGLYKYGILRI